eukprot:m.458181 g.458181  ORF g.458181 m.458181 type:complete len:97 (-) comp21438_c0_seq1:991-1281(-)
MKSQSITGAATENATELRPQQSELDERPKDYHSDTATMQSLNTQHKSHSESGALESVGLRAISSVEHKVSRLLNITLTKPFAVRHVFISTNTSLPR